MPSRTAHARTWGVALVAIAAYIIPTQASDQAGYSSPVALNMSVIQDGVTLAPLSSKLDFDVLTTHVMPTSEGTMFAFGRVRAGATVPDAPVLLTPLSKLTRASRPLPITIADTRYVAIPTSDGLFLVDPAAPGAGPAVIPEVRMVDVVVDDVNLDGHDDLVGIGASGGKKGKDTKKKKEVEPDLPPGNSTPGTPTPGNLSPSGVQIWLGNGSSFVPSHSLGLSADYFAALDVDRDGDTDLVVFDNGGYSVRVNDGGIFTAPAPFVLLDASVDTAPLAVYANDDGVADLVFGSGGSVLVMMGTEAGFDPPQTLFTIPAPAGQQAFVTSVELMVAASGKKGKKKSPPALAITSYADSSLQPVMVSTKGAAGFGLPVAVSPAHTAMDIHWAAGHVDANSDGLDDLVVLANGSLAFMHGLPSLADYHALQSELAYLDDAYAGLQQQHAMEMARLNAAIAALETSNATLAAAVELLNLELADAIAELKTAKVALKTSQLELARMRADRDALLLRVLGEPHSAVVAALVFDHAQLAFDEISETAADPRLKQAAKHLALAEQARAAGDYREAIRASRRAYQVVQRVIEDPKPAKPKQNPKPTKDDKNADPKSKTTTDTKDM